MRHLAGGRQQCLVDFKELLASVVLLLKLGITLGCGGCTVLLLHLRQTPASAGHAGGARNLGVVPVLAIQHNRRAIGAWTICQSPYPPFWS
ncbi:hypothetical protein D3C81_764650 [compost metagenome]